jgi:hypothetical protein
MGKTSAGSELKPTVQTGFCTTGTQEPASIYDTPAREIPHYIAGAKFVSTNPESRPVDGIADGVIYVDAADALPIIMQCLETT